MVGLTYYVCFLENSVYYENFPPLLHILAIHILATFPHFQCYPVASQCPFSFSFCFKQRNYLGRWVPPLFLSLLNANSAYEITTWCSWNMDSLDSIYIFKFMKNLLNILLCMFEYFHMWFIVLKKKYCSKRKHRNRKKYILKH